jgi:serine/threonine protein kinase/tetratricopeptide (TPR) repeat protein
MIGKTILHYNILEELGRGGMGVVYKAEDTKLKRHVAIKFLPKHISSDGEERERFKIEAQSAASLSHPNIATIFNIEEADDELFIVMEFIDGQELKDRISAGPLTIDESLEIATKIAKGLQAAHKSGIVHRDIKSSNIMLKGDGQVKIMDFGLAKVHGGKQITKAGTTLGTAAYMSPEQTSGDQVDHRSDIWSLGVLSYEMITGQLPFKGDYDQAITYSILNEEQQPITGLRTGIPMEMERIVNKCLQKDPSDRYQHADELIVDLRQLKKEYETSKLLSKTGISKISPQKQKRSFAVPGIIAVVVIMLIAGYFFFGRETESTERIPIAVADFVNQTNEPELNGLSGMLITALEQSNRLAVLTRSRMFDVLKQLGEGDVDFIDEQLGTEICKQANIQVLAIASIRKLGNRYAIDLKVLDPLKDEYLFTAKEEGEGQESVFSMIDKLAEITRAEMKEKAEQIHAARQNVADAVTTNLEAYHHYFKGEELISHVKFRESEDEFRKAIAIDTSFALAYYRLAYAIVWWGSERAKEPIRKAMQFIQNVPEKERYYIQSMNEVIEGNIDQALKTYKKLLVIYPDEKEALYQLGDWSFHKTDYETAIEYLEKVLTMDPLFERAYQHIIWTYWAMDQYDKALEYCKHYLARVPGEQAYNELGETYYRKNDLINAFKTYRQALEIFPISSNIIRGLGETHIFNNEYEKAKAEFTKLIQDSRPLSDKREGYQLLALLNAYLGKYHETLKMLDYKIEIDMKMSDSTALAADYAEKAFWLVAGMNNRVEAEKEINKGLRLEHKADEEFHRPLFYYYIIKEEYQNALTVSQKDFWANPNFDIVANAYLDKAKGKYDEAMKNFQKAILIGNYKYPTSYELGQLYFEIEQYENAILAIKTGQVTNQSNVDFPLRPLHYPKSFNLLGKIYEKKGNTKIAIENYEKFLDLWKDADPDIPELIDAKERLAKLKGVL